MSLANGEMAILCLYRRH